MEKYTYLRIPDDHSFNEKPNSKDLRKIIGACFNNGVYVDVKTAEFILEKMVNMNIELSRDNILNVAYSHCILYRDFD